MINLDLYNKAERFVVDALQKSHNDPDIYHARRTAYWIRVLKPDADEALLVAGLAHDIERAFYGDWKAGSDDSQKLQKHQDLSAEEISKFLESKKVEPKIIERVADLIRHHETGGTEEQNILCDADCLAYFEEKAMRNARKYNQAGKVEEFKKKLTYVFNRIHSQRARSIAQRWYDEALNELD